jgi:hypothetical protein
VRQLLIGGLVVGAGLGAADFVLTHAVIRQGVGYEANPVAAAWLDLYGWVGLGAFKALAAVAFLGTVVLLARRKPGAAVALVGANCAALVFVVGESCRLLAAAEPERPAFLALPDPPDPPAAQDTGPPGPEGLPSRVRRALPPVE